MTQYCHVYKKTVDCVLDVEKDKVKMIKYTKDWLHFIKISALHTISHIYDDIHISANYVLLLQRSKRAFIIYGRLGGRGW